MRHLEHPLGARQVPQRVFAKSFHIDTFRLLRGSNWTIGPKTAGDFTSAEQARWAKKLGAPGHHSLLNAVDTSHPNGQSALVGSGCCRAVAAYRSAARRFACALLIGAVCGCRNAGDAAGGAFVMGRGLC
jgi:hypothetical protein